MIIYKLLVILATLAVMIKSFRPIMPSAIRRGLSCRMVATDDALEVLVPIKPEKEMKCKDRVEGKQKTSDRIEWKAAVRSSCRVKESSRTAEQYMALPASQYSVLAADQIERLNDTQFKATLGKLNFFGNIFIPILYVDVEVFGEDARAEILVRILVNF